MPKTWEEKKELVEETFSSNAECEVKVDDEKAFTNKPGSSSLGSSCTSIRVTPPKAVPPAPPPAVKPPPPIEIETLFKRLTSVSPRYWWLTGLMPRATEMFILKELGYHFEILNIRVKIPAQTKVESLFKIPELEVWWLWKEVHDVPVETFKHRSVSDGMPMHPPMLVCGHNMSMAYNIPFYTLDYALYEVENVSDADEWFNLGVRRTIEPKWIFERRSELIHQLMRGE